MPYLIENPLQISEVKYVTGREDIPFIYSLQNVSSRMMVKSALVLKNTFLPKRVIKQQTKMKIIIYLCSVTKAAKR
jgi:hypothetical protein